MFKKILLVAALLFPMLASAQTVKIGLVDTQSIISVMPETTAAQNKITETSKKYDEEYKKLGEEMQRMYTEYQNMAEDEPNAIKERKTRELSDMQQKMQQFEQTAMQDLQKLQNDLMAPIMQKVKTAIDAVGQEGGYTIIQETASVIYFGAPAQDVTAQVKAKLNL